MKLINHLLLRITSLACSFPLLLFPEIEVSQVDGQIRVLWQGEPTLVYQAETLAPPPDLDPAYAGSGFILSLRTPSGVEVLDPFPWGRHTHQHGIFSAWTQATFKHYTVDFWNQGKGHGFQRHRSIDDIFDDGFAITREQVSTEHGPAITESWEIRARESNGLVVIDFSIQQQTATTEEVYLHPYHYGGFAVRGSAGWNREDPQNYQGPTRLLTSEGHEDAQSANHVKTRWFALYGPTGDATAGLVVMDHPRNFRHPQPVRVAPEVPYFVFSPVVEGSFILRPGWIYHARYRIVAFDGPPDPKKLEKLYEDFAQVGLR